MKKVLVSGGAGFIGSHVVDAHVARGDRVWVVDDFSTGRRANLNPEAEVLESDVAHGRVRELMRDVGFDVVSHHAAQIDVRVSVEDPLRDARTNVLGLLNLAEGALETGVDRLVYVSSGGVVYGEPEERPTPETAPKGPLSPYGVSKLAGEHYLHYYRRVRGLEYVALRYANVYGPRQDPHGEAGVVSIFANRLIEDTPLTVFGDGEQTRDYVFVQDVVAANLRALDLPLEGAPAGIDDRAFNVGTGVGTSVNRLADLLEEIAGRHPGREYHGERPGELRHSTLDASRLRGHGWAPAAPLRDGLRATYEFIAGSRTGRP